MSVLAADEGQGRGAFILRVLAEAHGLKAPHPQLGADATSLASLKRAAEQAGFLTQAGRLASYQELTELAELPAVAHLRRKCPLRLLTAARDGAPIDLGKDWAFVVVHRVDGDAVEVEEPSGRKWVPREEFVASWRGVIMCVAPEAPTEEARRWPSLPPGALVAAVGASTVAVAVGLSDRVDPLALKVALGAALAGALWSWVSVPRCATCADASHALGMPLAPPGVALYAALLALEFWGPPLEVVRWGLALAGGVHLALVTLLLARRAWCSACVATAFAAWLALGIAGAGVESPGREAAPQQARHGATTVRRGFGGCRPGTGHGAADGLQSRRVHAVPTAGGAGAAGTAGVVRSRP
jgi:hypothetical protein